MRKLLLVALIRGWQLVVSPWYGQTCRFYPSCSSYGIDALRTHGLVRGTGLTVWRLLRCNPWNQGGVDPVPLRGGIPGPQSSTEPTRRSPATEGPGTVPVDSAADRSAEHGSPERRAPLGGRAA